GGWTLEQINPFTPYTGAGNWRASNAPAGGTPGTANSVLDPTPDTTPPTLVGVQVIGNTQLELIFNEPMAPASLNTATYVIQPPLPITVASPTFGTDDRVRLVLAQPIPLGVVHTVSVTGATDCPGNAIAPGTSASFALPEPVAPGDVVINEVLYDPEGDGSDFVELYNRSDKTISLAGLQLANETNGQVGNYRVITTDGVLLLPGEYILLTGSPADILARYPQSRADRLLQMTLPGYNNGEGTVVFTDAANGVLDRFAYNDDLHFPLVSKPEGYSLERVDPDRPAEDATNWQTASDQAGRATPGFQNSQYAEAPAPSGELTIEPAIFSPDNDGFQDVLTIVYRFDQPGYVGNMNVYDIAGREVRKLMENVLLGTEGAISWDGLLAGGDKGRMGPYIVVLEVFDLDGNVEKYRRTVTLAHRL
nr:lamin tail domain-containing protein [Flavobacteriales bacterium]